MIQLIKVKNYKSIKRLKLELGQFNVLIGENDAGKTNILETIALATNTVDESSHTNFLKAKSLKDIARDPSQDIEIDLSWRSGDRVEFRRRADASGCCHFISANSLWKPSKEFVIYDRTKFSTVNWSPAIGLTINGVQTQTLPADSLDPEAFAIEDFGAFLNPRLSRRIVQELIAFGKKHDRQIFLTTHQPGALDGLDLEDENQKLFSVCRNNLGYTLAHKISPPKTMLGEEPVDLSEAFLRGYIGGLSSGF